MSHTRQQRPIFDYEPILRTRDDTTAPSIFRPHDLPRPRPQPARDDDTRDTQQLYAGSPVLLAAHRPPQRRRPVHAQPTAPTGTEQNQRPTTTPDPAEQVGTSTYLGARPLAAPFHAHLVSQELFLTNFSDSMYRPARRGYSLDLGLAAAQLCDLVLEHTIQIRDGQIRLAPHCPADDTAAPVAIQAMHDDRSARPDDEAVDRPIGDWIDIIAQDACEHVAQTLIGAGVVRRTAPRRWQRKPLPFEITPAGQIATATPRGRLLSTATTGGELSRHDVALFALLGVLDLDHVITTGAVRRAASELHAAVTRLGQPDPDADRSPVGRFRPPTADEYTGRALQDILAALALLLHREATRR